MKRKWKAERKNRKHQGKERWREDQNRTKACVEKRGIESQRIWVVKTYEAKTKTRKVEMEKEVKRERKDRVQANVETTRTLPVRRVSKQTKRSNQEERKGNAKECTKA